MAPGKEALGVTRDAAADSGGPGRTLLTPLIHGRARLLILSFLLRQKGAVPFIDLRKSLGFTDGALSVHLSKLEAGQLITLEKRFVGKRPQTLVKPTPEGRKAFREYVADLRDIVPGLD